MSEKEWYSIAEFAEKVGQSRQTIDRKATQGVLQEFTEIVMGKKQVNKGALKLFFEDDVTGETKNETEKSGFYGAIKKTLKNLENQLEEKDKQIAELQRQNARYQDLLENSQRGESETRQLHLMEKQERMKQLPETGKIETILKEMEGLGAKSGDETRVAAVKEQIKVFREGMEVGKVTINDGKIEDKTRFDTGIIDGLTDELRALMHDAVRVGYEADRSPWYKKLGFKRTQ